MRKLRTFIALFLLGIGCGKPLAEPQGAQQSPSTTAPPAQIPASVGASRRTPVVVVAHNVLPSVVNIQTEATIRQRQIDPFFDPFGFFGGRQRAYTSQSLGSGFVWSSDGIIVTNNHVVEGASHITVNINGGKQIPATLIGVDPASDLAVLRVDEKGLPAAPIGTSSDLMIGETVVAVGNPFGLSGTVTTGVVSAVGRSVPSQDQSRTFTDFIQTDASINPGNSGGPLVNLEGKVIGINVAIYERAQGIGFAIPVDRAKKVIGDLLAYGEVHQAWFGAVTATLTPEEAKRLGHEQQRGVVVERIFEKSPAASAGLRTGDVISAVAGKPVDSREAFSTAIATLAPGANVELTVHRDGDMRRVNLRASEPPADLGLRILEEIAGIRVADERRAIVVDDVLRGSRAAEIGLAPGDIVIRVNGSSVKDTRELNTQVMAGAERSSIVLTVQRGRYAYNLTFPMGN